MALTAAPSSSLGCDCNHCPKGFVRCCALDSLSHKDRDSPGPLRMSEKIGLLCLCKSSLGKDMRLQCCFWLTKMAVTRFTFFPLVPENYFLVLCLFSHLRVSGALSSTNRKQVLCPHPCQLNFCLWMESGNPFWILKIYKTCVHQQLFIVTKKDSINICRFLIIC